MTEHGGTHGVEADEAPAPSPSSRFGRLLDSPGERRPSPARLTRTLVMWLVAIAAPGIGLAWLARSMTGWVGSRPEYQIPFSRIELVPTPPPYIRGGATSFLEQIRLESRPDEPTFSLLAVDLDSIRLDFLHSPWVKGVTRVERSPGRLAVHLQYREPIAVVEFDPGRALVIDEEGVILPPEDRDIDWVEKGPRFLVRGIAAPLIEIRGVGRPAGTLAGLRWKRADGSPDPQVLGAASLARFLRSREAATPGNRPLPRFIRLIPVAETARLFLVDAANQSILWGEAPGAESRGLPTAEAKWAMLRAWIDDHGSLALKPGDYLMFDHAGARVGGTPRPRHDPTR